MPIAKMRPGFTLIELLVVITIIVVLLSLLTPSLDRAIYQAELIACSAKLDAVATSVTNYAFDFRRNYPFRNGVDTAGDRRPEEIKIWIPGSAAHGDDRPVIRDHMPINSMMQCPLNEQRDIELSDDDSNIQMNYSFYYGWHYTSGGQRLKGMKRIGDAFAWNPRSFDAAAEDVSYRFRVIAADADAFGADQPVVQAGHPDKQGILRQLSIQDTDVVTGSSVEVAGTNAGTLKYTAAFWEGFTDDRGEMDRNFAFQDGSVTRVRDLTLNDDRLVEVPERCNTVNYPFFMTWLPRN